MCLVLSCWLFRQTAEGATYLQVIIMLAAFAFVVAPAFAKVVRDWFRDPPPQNYRGKRK